MLNLNRKNFYNEFGYADFSSWDYLQYYSMSTSAINRRILDWIRDHYLSSSSRLGTVRGCKKQVIIVWTLFLEWLESNELNFSVQDIDGIILQQFKSELTFLGWSASAIQFIEAVAIKVSLYLQSKQIFYSSPYKKSFYSNHAFYILVQDYRTIRNYIYETGSDYEIILFEFATILPSYSGRLYYIKGSDFIFHKDRYYLRLKGILEKKHKIYPCPLDVSKRIDKLMKSRNITNNEVIFDCVRRIWSSLDQKIRIVCLDINIPFFAIDAIWGFLNFYIKYLVFIGLYKHSTVKPLLSGHRKIASYKNRMSLLDKLYTQIKEGDTYHEISLNAMDAVAMRVEI